MGNTERNTGKSLFRKMSDGGKSVPMLRGVLKEATYLNKGKGGGRGGQYYFMKTEELGEKRTIVPK